ncbi:hypothetical protein ABZ401_15800 [Streptomyces sp. NPDC005892]|uniref:hypothetical protein n=1 Tax=Streptomyces sp. NPDC005892 TaxID=3155593 RepID=UPI003408C2FF
MGVYARTTHPPIASRERHMHGYGYPPELPTARPSPATLTVLRVVFVVLTVLSCGFLAWAAMLRLAIVTRRPRDWGLFVLSLALTAGLGVYMDKLPGGDTELTDSQAFTTLGWMFALLGGVTWYYLFSDLRHFGPNGPTAVAARARTATGYPVAGPVQGYGYPPATPVHGKPPYGTPPYPSVPQQHQPQPPQHQHQPQPPQHQPQPTPPPKRPGPPQRLDQVRAELDELSDYLRKEGEGR